ncbi:MAG TPA: class 1 fructose-bisphosphatase [Ignavibacteria bacterium]|nr:class 1 fructose-bisphosphatase [Ignavibacteria bacterium]HMR39425.1 class 1 fructose-bisphosphatase [Ignavibacteria bacterium]
MVNNKFTTFYRHIIDQERKFPDATGQLSDLLADIALACKVISLEVNRAGLIDILGFTGEENVQGEQVKKLDVFANDVLTHVMKQGGHTCAVCSEEEENFLPIEDKYSDSNYLTNKYICHFDPLDGSSNIDVNVSIGTIFSVYKRVSNSGPGSLEDCLQRGVEQVAAGYVIYGSSTVLVYTNNEGVHGFTLDPSVGEFLLSNENIKIPKRSKTYSVNEGNYCNWSDGMKKYISYIKENDPDTLRPFSSRYVGSLVADFHRNLLYGGVFMYPPDAKNKNGKLRLMYEANPLSFIVEQAGGRSSNGKKRIMEIEPESLHQRTPLFIGSEEDVMLIEKFLAEDK